MRTVRAVAVGALTLLASGALAADTSLAIRGLGKAEVRWNSLRFRQEYLAQLQPGLTWRLGKDSATRLELEKMAFVAEDTILLPGTVALNLRFWSMRSWELIAFELTPDVEGWKWGEDKAQYGVVRARMGSYPGEDEITKSLELSLVRNTKGSRSDVPRPAITGGHADLAQIWEVPDDVEYAAEIRERWELLETVEFTVRFGSHVVICDFEAAPVTVLKGSVPGTDGDERKIEIHCVELPDPEVRRVFLDEFEGAIPLGVVTRGHPSGQPVLISVSGSETPYLWVKTRDGQEEVGEPVEGTRRDVASPLKKVKKRVKGPAAVAADLDGSTLTVHMGKVDYVFELWSGASDE